MPGITYTYKGSLPYHSSHKLDGKWRDICLGNGDTVIFTDAEAQNPAIKNLVKTGRLVSDTQPPKKTKKPAKTKEPQTNNDQQTTNPQ